MDRPQLLSEHGKGGAAGTRVSAATPQISSLPPTRAARPARSRGVFFGEGRLGRFARGAAFAAAVAVSAVSLATLAPRVIEAPPVLLNPGPALVAAASKLPTMLAPER